MNLEQNGSCDQKNFITQILQSLYNFISTLGGAVLECLGLEKIISETLKIM